MKSTGTFYQNATEILSITASSPHANIAELDMPVMVTYESTAYDCRDSEDDVRNWFKT
jgi:hypothetical protein